MREKAERWLVAVSAAVAATAAAVSYVLGLAHVSPVVGVAAAVVVALAGGLLAYSAERTIKLLHQAGAIVAPVWALWATIGVLLAGLAMVGAFHLLEKGPAGPREMVVSEAVKHPIVASYAPHGEANQFNGGQFEAGHTVEVECFVVKDGQRWGRVLEGWLPMSLLMPVDDQPATTLRRC